MMEHHEALLQMLKLTYSSDFFVAQLNFAAIQSLFQQDSQDLGMFQHVKFN